MRCKRGSEVNDERCIFNVSRQPQGEGGNVLVVFWLQFLDF